MKKTERKPEPQQPKSGRGCFVGVPTLLLGCSVIAFCERIFQMEVGSLFFACLALIFAFCSVRGFFGAPNAVPRDPKRSAAENNRLIEEERMERYALSGCGCIVFFVLLALAVCICCGEREMRRIRAEQEIEQKRLRVEREMREAGQKRRRADARALNRERARHEQGVGASERFSPDNAGEDGDPYDDPDFDDLFPGEEYDEEFVDRDMGDPELYDE